MTTEDVSIAFPAPIGSVRVGRWIYSCNPFMNIFQPVLAFRVAIDLEIDMGKIASALGKFSRLVPNNSIQDFANQARQLAPQGKIGFMAAFYPEMLSVPCPGSTTRAMLVGYSLKLNLIGTMEGSYGVAAGRAHVMVSAEIANDSHTCTCPTESSASETALYIPEYGQEAQDFYALDKPNIPANYLIGFKESNERTGSTSSSGSSRPCPPSQPPTTTEDPVIISGPIEVISTNVETGITRKLAEY